MVTLLNQPLRMMYRALSKAIPFEICRLLVLDLAESRQPKRDASCYEFGFIDAFQVTGLFGGEEKHTLHAMEDLLRADEASCFAATFDGQLAAYAWFATGCVPGMHNRGGNRYRGIELAMPPTVAYLFNAFVTPDHRGRALSHWICHNAGLRLRAQRVTHFVATTEWTNNAFLKSARRGGFRHRGYTVECMLGNQQFCYARDLKDIGATLGRSSNSRNADAFGMQGFGHA